MDAIVVGACFVLVMSQSSALNYPRLSFGKVCYNDPPVGCFPNHAGYRPQSPDTVQVSFIHHTQEGSQRLALDQIQHVNFSKYDPGLKTILIIHGYSESAAHPWTTEMVQAFLDRGLINVLVVDWQEGAQKVNFLQSAANTKVVGAIGALFLQHLFDLGTDASSIHLIGYSLGAHVAGEIGSRIPGIGRITGLDPAGPSFEGEDPAARLDPTDAIFVDVVHTDGGNGDRWSLDSVFAMGMTSPCGTVDFYPNGGVHQPGCTVGLQLRLALLQPGQSTINDRLISFAICSHMRSVVLFLASLTQHCDYQMSRCLNPGQAHADTCTPCGEGECPHFGYDVDTNIVRRSVMTTSVVFRYATSRKFPFCCKSTFYFT